MRDTSILTKLLAIEHTRVIGFELDEDAVVLVVKSRKKVPRCGGCWRKCRHVHDRRHRRWRHLDVMGIECWLAGEVRRVRCPRCRRDDRDGAVGGARQRLHPRARDDARVTRAADGQDDRHAPDAHRLDAHALGDARRDATDGLQDPLDGLKHIAIDELSYKRHHHYITIVINEGGDVVWAAPGRSANTLRAFFDEIGKTTAAALETVSVDLSPAFTSALKARCPNATIVYDRFHVQRLAHDALDCYPASDCQGYTSLACFEADRDSGDPYPCWETNQTGCSTSCSGLVVDDAGNASVTCDRYHICGRRLDGLEPCAPGDDGPARLFAQMAWLEAASVRAFERLARELAAHDAPQDLVRAARKAAREEARHAREMARIAHKFGASPPRVRVRRVRRRSLEAIAIENAVEGCVGETYGALFAAWQRTHATDRDFRAALDVIAPDELGHAALAWQVARWAEARLDAEANARVRVRRDRAMADLVAARHDDLSPVERRVSGAPSPVDARRLARDLVAALNGSIASRADSSLEVPVVVVGTLRHAQGSRRAEKRVS